MPLSVRRGHVTAVGDVFDDFVRLEVDGVRCVAYPRLTGSVEVGDEGVVNVQARELGLGSGGFDVVVVNLTRGLDLAPDPDAHVMKLPYTQLPGGALPVALSDTVRVLRERGLVEATVGAGACFGGDADCVTVYSALA